MGSDIAKTSLLVHESGDCPAIIGTQCFFILIVVLSLFHKNFMEKKGIRLWDSFNLCFEGAIDGYSEILLRFIVLEGGLNHNHISASF